MSSSRVWRAAAAGAWRWRSAGRIAREASSLMREESRKCDVFRFPGQVRSFSQQALLRKEDEEKNAGLEKLSVLYGKLDQVRGSGCLQVVKDWKAQGNTLSPEILTKICAYLADKRQYVQAQKILQANREEKLAELTPSLCSLELDILCRQHGASKAEHVYNSLPGKMKTGELQEGLMLSFANYGAALKVEQWFEQIKPVKAETWNGILKMYLFRGKHNKVFATYNNMKEASVDPTAATYGILLECKDVAGGPEEIEKEVEAGLDSIELETADLTTLESMIVGYGYLRKKQNVDKVWSVLKSHPQAKDKSYCRGMKTFGLIGEVSKAEQVLEEMVAAGNVVGGFPYITMLEVYTRNGVMDRAEDLVQTKIKELDGHVYSCIISGYLAKNEPEKALETYDKLPQTVSLLEYKTVFGLLEVFASRKNKAAAERLINDRYPCYRGDARLFNELLKAYVAAEERPTNFRKRLAGHFVEPNEETEELLKRCEKTVQTRQRREKESGESERGKRVVKRQLKMKATGWA